MRTSQALGGLAAALAAAAAVHGQATTIYVDRSAPANGTGLSWGQAFGDLQDALALAAVINQSGTVVKVAQGIYTPDRGTGNRMSSFVVASGVTLMGGFAGLAHADPDERDPGAFVSVLSGDLRGDDESGFTRRGDNAIHVVTAGSLSVMDGVVIRGGFADGSGQGFTDVGAAVVGGDSAVFADCRIEDNFAASAGAIAWSVPARISFFNCVLTGNLVGNSSLPSQAAALVAGQVNVFNCRVVANTHPGPLVRYLEECDLFGNLIAGNRSTLGAVLLDGVSGRFRLASNTIVQNSGARGLLSFSGPANIGLVHCIVWDNQSGLPDGQLVDHVPAGSGASFSYCIVRHAAQAIPANQPGVTSLMVRDTDPLFVSSGGVDADPTTVADNDYHLRPGSPAIDAGNWLVPGDSDLDRNPRVVDDPGTPDMHPSATYKTLDLGAFEFQGTSCRADWNGSGQVRADDVPAFIDSWFVLDPRADYNRTDGVTLQDLFDFLTGYFTGCP